MCLGYEFFDQIQKSYLNQNSTVSFIPGSTNPLVPISAIRTWGLIDLMLSKLLALETEPSKPWGTLSLVIFTAIEHLS